MKNWKITLLSLFIILTGTLLLTNVLFLDIKGKTLFNDTNFKDDVKFSIAEKTIIARRGTIYDSEGNILATDTNVYKIIFILSDTHKKTVTTMVDGKKVKEVINDYVEDPLLTAKEISSILDVSEDYLYQRLTSDKYQVEIGTAGSNLSYDTKLKIEALGLPGITFESSTTRSYPLNEFASYLIGYVQNGSEDNPSIHGVAGIEATLNEQLKGIDGYQKFYKDAAGNVLAGGYIEEKEAINGFDVHLTINNRIQEGLDDFLESCMNIADDVEKAWGIVIDAKTGKILGYDSYPTFNPNLHNMTNFNDLCATLPYEPGSTMKTYTYAAAIDLGKFDEHEILNCNNYYLTTDKNGNIKRTTPDQKYIDIIHNDKHKQYGDVEYYEAYVRSFNVGTVTLLEEKIGKDNFISYLDRFGFLKKVNVFGINESTNYGQADFETPFALACSSFGSGMSATALQIVQGYTAFCNEGMMIRPYVIDSIVDPNTGEIVYSGERVEVSQVVSKETAQEVLHLMEGVVNSGLHMTAQTYKLDGVTVGGKTGTAPVAENGHYTEKTIHSLILAMPIEDPQVIIYVAYQDSNSNVRYAKLVNKLEKVVANTLGLSSDPEANQYVKEKEVFQLDSLINHSLDYVNGKSELKANQIIILGDGNQVINQFPEAGSTILSTNRILLLTSQDNFIMPDMTDWSRSEVIGFWDLTGLHIEIEGYGYVSSQSIDPGTYVDKSMSIVVHLE